jgi:hypothetical protein
MTAPRDSGPRDRTCPQCGADLYASGPDLRCPVHGIISPGAPQ